METETPSTTPTPAELLEQLAGTIGGTMATIGVLQLEIADRFATDGIPSIDQLALARDHLRHVEIALRNVHDDLAGKPSPASLRAVGHE